MTILLRILCNKMMVMMIIMFNKTLLDDDDGDYDGGDHIVTDLGQMILTLTMFNKKWTDMMKICGDNGD
jgi:hypothetical protein